MHIARYDWSLHTVWMSRSGESSILEMSDLIVRCSIGGRVILNFTSVLCIKETVVCPWSSIFRCTNVSDSETMSGVHTFIIYCI